MPSFFRLESPILRALYLISAIAPLWLTKYPPLTDLPQHAGQIALILQLLHGDSPWQDLVSFNYFTPYLFGYGVGSLLALLFPIVAAVKIVLSVTLIAFYGLSTELRRRLQAPAELDWLILPGFFGFAYLFGFYTFLVAAPVGIAFILVSIHYSQRSSFGSGLLVAATGVFLFFCHGLIFMASAAVGGLYAIAASRSARGAALRLLPYYLMAALAVAYFLAAKSAEVNTASVTLPWEWDLALSRPIKFVYCLWNENHIKGHIVLQQVPHMIFFAVLLLTPFLLGYRFRPTLRTGIPFAVIMLIGLLVPNTAIGVGYLYERFSIFILPFYILQFVRPAPGEPQSHRRTLAWRHVMLVMLPMICFLHSGWRSWQAIESERETQAFDTVIRSIPDGAHVLALVRDKRSVSTNNDYAYQHFPLWLQAEHKAFVDPNFAMQMAMVVRYRPQVFDSAAFLRMYDLGETPQVFDWVQDKADRYDYYIVRGAGRPLDTLLQAPGCVNTLARAGGWVVLKRCAAVADKT